MKKTLFVILLLIVAAGAVYFLYPKSSDNGKSDRSGNGGGLTGNTKSYNSAQFGISFEYSASWLLSEDEPGLVILKPDASITDELAPISIDVRGVEPYEEAVREIRETAVGKSETAMTFGKYPAAAISGKLSADVGEHAGAPFTFTMINYGGWLYSIDYIELGPEPASARDVYLGIVASFKFADPL